MPAGKNAWHRMKIYMTNCAEHTRSSAPELTRRFADVSAIVTTVDRPAELARCLDAILAGDVLPAEVIVVDQGDQGADALLQLRAAMGVRLVHVRQPRRGLSAARNGGLAMARCPIVAITDDDCCPDQNWIATVAAVFEAPDAPEAV